MPLAVANRPSEHAGHRPVVRAAVSAPRGTDAVRSGYARPWAWWAVVASACAAFMPRAGHGSRAVSSSADPDKADSLAAAR